MIKNQVTACDHISIAELFDIKGLFIVIDIRKCNVVP